MKHQNMSNTVLWLTPNRMRANKCRQSGRTRMIRRVLHTSHVGHLSVRNFPRQLCGVSSFAVPHNEPVQQPIPCESIVNLCKITTCQTQSVICRIRIATCMGACTKQGSTGQRLGDWLIGADLRDARQTPTTTP